MSPPSPIRGIFQCPRREVLRPIRSRERTQSWSISSHFRRPHVRNADLLSNGRAETRLAIAAPMPREPPVSKRSVHVSIENLAKELLLPTARVAINLVLTVPRTLAK